MKLRYWRVGLLGISLTLWTVLLGGIVVNKFWVPSFATVGHLERGCYLTDALWFYVQCNGFAFSEMAGAVLTFPYLVWISPVVILSVPLFVIPLWFFLLFPGWYAWSRIRRS